MPRSNTIQIIQVWRHAKELLAARGLHEGHPGYFKALDETFRRLLHQMQQTPLDFDGDVEVKRNPDEDELRVEARRLARRALEAGEQGQPHVVNAINHELTIVTDQFARYFMRWEHLFPTDAQRVAEATVTAIIDEVIDERDAESGEYRLRNPGGIPQRNPSADVLSWYNRFHETDPGDVEEVRVQSPIALVLLGTAIDVGYKAIDRHSSKGESPYVHDHGSGVKVYRPARAGEQADKTWHVPAEMGVLGKALGFTYRDKLGKPHEVKGHGKLATTPARRTLAIIGQGGIKYVIEGGALVVDDWIRN